MLRALAWKEWRQQRPVVVAGLALAAGLPPFVLAGMSLSGGRVDLRGLVEILPMIYAALLWPLFAAAAGGSLIAGEVGEGTLPFLLSRPVSRARIWMVKSATGLVSTGLVMLGTLALAEVLRRLIGAGGGPAWVNGPRSFPLAAGVANAALFFAASAFLSGLVSRPMTAAAGGVAASLGIVTLLGILWAHLDLVPRLEPGWMSLELALSAAAILPASLYVFARGEMLRGRGARKAAALGGAVALAAAALASLPVFVQALRLDPQAATLWNASLSPSRDALVATASRADGGSSEVWWVPTDGSGVHRLSGRLAFAGAFTPGGDVVYLSQRGALGLRRAGSTELWRASPGRPGGQRLGSGLPDYLGAAAHARLGGLSPLASPDGRRFAISFGEDVYVVDEEGDVSRIDLRGTELEGCEPLGWSPDSSDLVLFRSHWKEPARSVVGTYHPDTGAIRPVLETEDRFVYPFWAGDATPMTGDGGVLLRAWDGEETRLLEIRLADGEQRELARSSCLTGVDRSEDGRILAFARCVGKVVDGRRSEIRLLDRTSGQQRVLGTVAGTVGSLHLSPSGERVAVALNDPGRQAAMVVGPDGEVAPFEGSWSVLGWAGRDGVVLMRGWETPTRIAIGSPDGRVQRTIFPPQ